MMRRKGTIVDFYRSNTLYSLDIRRLCGLIVRVRVVPRRTVVGDIDRRFDNLSGSHHQSHVNCVSSVYGIYVSGQFSRDDPSRDYSHPDDQTTQTTETPGFKPFTVLDIRIVNFR